MTDITPNTDTDTDTPATITEIRICSTHDNAELLRNPGYRKIPTPRAGSAPFIWTADIAYAPEAIIMVARDLPIHFIPAQR